VAKPRKVLGRGLDALIPSRPSAQEARLDDIVPSRHQPRTTFDEPKLTELAESVRVHGIIQPLIVTPPGEDGKRKLIAGERRWQAARQAGLEMVPIVEREADGETALEMALVENIQRQGLSPLEEAAAFDRLSREHGLTQEEIASRVGRARSSVANVMRLLSLPSSVRNALAEGSISEGHARALLGLDSPDLIDAILDRIVELGLSVREAEQLVKRANDGPRPRQATAKDADLTRLESDLQQSLGTKVLLQPSRKGGRIVIEWYSREELMALTDRLLPES